VGSIPAKDQLTVYHYGGTTPAYPGDVTSVTDPDLKDWQYRYDAFGDLASVTDPLGYKTTYGYNTARGWRTSAISPRGNVAGAGDHPAQLVQDVQRDRRPGHHVGQEARRAQVVGLLRPHPATQRA